MMGEEKTMVKQESIVTPERFSKGLNYKDYIAQITVNKDKFDSLYDQFQITDEDRDFFNKAVLNPKGPTKMLVLGEDWCPDVYRGIPVMAKIAEASGMELKIFPRDLNLDIMAEFLKDGEFMSIPVAVFYSKDHSYIGHWIERSKMINEERSEIEKQVKKDLPDADDKSFRSEMRKRASERFDIWQQASVDEMRQIIAQHLNT